VLNHKRLTAAESEQLWEDMTEALRRLDSDAAEIPDAFAAWEAPGAAAFESSILAEWIAGLDVSDLCKRGVDAQMVSDNGVACDWQSYLGNLAMIKGGGLEHYWADTEVFRCAGGSDQLASNLARAIGGERIHLRQPVSTMAVTDRGVRVTTSAAAVRRGLRRTRGAPADVESHHLHAPAPCRGTPQMGSNVKFLMRTRDQYWKRAGLAPDR
jgi:monoamine oxidase